MAIQICIFEERGGGLFDGCWNKFVRSGRSGHTVIIVLCVVKHAYDIINNYFDIQAYLDHEDVRKFNLGAVRCVLYYIITYSSNSTLLMFLDPPESLLHINYLQNIITAML